MKPERSFFAALPQWLNRLSARHPRFVIGAVAVLLALSALALMMTPLASDVTRLIPADAERTSLYFRLMEDFGTMEKLYVVFTSDDIRAHLDDIDRIGAEIEELDIIREARWKITPEQRTFIRETLLPKLPLYLNSTELDEFFSRLEPEAIEASLKRAKQRLVLPGSSATLMDPLGVWEAMQGRMKFADVNVDLASGYYITPEGKRLIMTASPTGSPRNVSFDRELITQVDALLEHTLPEGLEAEVTGSHAITLHEASIAKGEIVKNFFTALVAVLVIFAVFLRGLRGMVASILPVVLSIAVTTGLASFAAGAITEISGGFAGLLIGLGADLGIVLYVRYALLSSQGIVHPDAVAEGVRTAGAGITVGVFTTAATFLPMMLSSFRGIRELGLLTGMGILVTLLLLFTLFPMLTRRTSSRASSGSQTGHMAVTAVFEYSYSRPGPVIGTALGMTLLLCLFIPRIEIESDLTRLGSRNNPARDVLYTLERDYMPRNNVLFTGTAGTPAEASRRAAEIEAALSDEAREQAMSIAGLLPPMVRQEENLRKLAQIDPYKVRKDFHRTAKKLGMNPDAFDDYLEGLERTLSNTRPIGFDDLAPLEQFVDRVLKKESNGRWRFLVTASESGEVPEIEGVSVTGSGLLKAELLGLLGRDAALVTVVGLLLVNLILFAAFRRPSLVLLCQVPVALASVWVLGLMGLFGISLNFMNTIVFVMLFGIGTDYTIHLLHRRAQGGHIDAIARDTGSAVVLAGLTTLAGFGTMGLSAYRGLASLGAATALGVVACVIVSITLIPAFFGLQEKRNGDRNCR